MQSGNEGLPLLPTEPLDIKSGLLDEYLQDECFKSRFGTCLLCLLYPLDINGLQPVLSPDLNCEIS